MKPNDKEIKNMGGRKKKFYQCIWHDKFPACKACPHNVPHKVPPRGSGEHCIDEGECVPVKGHSIICKCMVYIPDTDEDAYLTPVNKPAVNAVNVTEQSTVKQTKNMSRVRQWLMNNK